MGDQPAGPPPGASSPSRVRRQISTAAGRSGSAKSSPPPSASSGASMQPLAGSSNDLQNARMKRGRSISRRFMQHQAGTSPLTVTPVSSKTLSAAAANSISALGFADSQGKLIAGAAPSAGGAHSQTLYGAPTPPALDSPLAKPTGRWWIITSRVLTFWAPSAILRRSNPCFHDKNIIQAWREKVALCIIFAVCGIALAFLTLGLNRVLCSGDESAGGFSYASGVTKGFARVGKSVYKFSSSTQLKNLHGDKMDAYIDAIDGNGGDASALFKYPSSSCPQALQRSTCSIPGNGDVFCHSATSKTLSSQKIGELYYSWEIVKSMTESKKMKLVIYGAAVIDVSKYLANSSFSFGDKVDAKIRGDIGQDASLSASLDAEYKQAAECLAELYTVGAIDQKSPGCIASQIILYISLIIILGVVLTRFFMAVLFDWFLSWKLGKLIASRDLYNKTLERPNSNNPAQHEPSPPASPQLSSAAQVPRPNHEYAGKAFSGNENYMPADISEGRVLASKRVVKASYFDKYSIMAPHPEDYDEDSLRQYYTVILVTCYSEGDDSMRATLDSIANCIYSDPHKLLFVVADGIITGSGNSKSTPDIVLDMVELVDCGPTDPQSYVAIADGKKRHNMAKVYVGWYVCGEHRVPTVVIVKVGAESERKASKPGNRGKRDGQIILMDFFSKLMFNDRLSPLQFDLYSKIRKLAGVDPIQYEICLMVDADTKLRPQSLSRLVAACAQDPSIMGLCGETRIENKGQTWVTSIQVFEYYISHHLGKAFESLFGGVTCLPGCFCMYRLKVRRRSDGNIVPILCSPTIIQQYSENVVDTLHKKNLLSLGEDRFLSSLMLRAFPKRKMMFVPKALCRTVVPHTLRMLLSQRRRWINSTIHNLFELALVRELCGTFCFSMQFVVMLELIGTITLPVAIILTLTLLGVTIAGDVQMIPLILLACILGLPAILILLTTRKVVYIYWMIIYLFSLPIWNFLLPVYAFWHFDDFSWGETRKVAGETKEDDHSKKEGEFDGSLIPLRYKSEWTQYLQQQRAQASQPQRESAKVVPESKKEGASATEAISPVREASLS